MYLLTQGESSGPSVQPPKRKRGRPRKDQSLKALEVGPSVGVKEHRPPITRGPEPILGLEVVGVIEAVFDCGYLLSVKIGNSNMRGVVFHPGQCVPITPENDVAPHLPMIKRKKTRLTGKKRKVAVQTASKCNYDPPETFVNPNGLQISDNGDADVEMVEPLTILTPVQPLPGVQENEMIEPLSILAPVQSVPVSPGIQEDGMVEHLSILPPVQSVPVSQILVDEIAPEMLQEDDGGSFNTDTTAVGQEAKDDPRGPSETMLDGEIEDVLKSSAENGGIPKLLQEDVKEGKAQICDELACVPQVELAETTMSTEANANANGGENESIG